MKPSELADQIDKLNRDFDQLAIYPDLQSWAARNLKTIQLTLRHHEALVQALQNADDAHDCCQDCNKRALVKSRELIATIEREKEGA